MSFSLISIVLITHHEVTRTQSPTVDEQTSPTLRMMYRSYKSLLPKMGGYICNEGKINWKRFQMLLVAIGSVEDDVFAERDRVRRSFLSRKRKPRDDHAMRKAARIEADAAKQIRLAETLGPHNDTFKNRYYLEKFGIAPQSKGETEESEVKIALCREYLRGLSWVLKYYYGGVASWEWYYPFHYAPLASDLLPTACSKLDEFNLGKPFLPFEQLLGCLPPESSNFLPRPFRDLMTLDSSPIADFYPDTFQIDMNGAHNPWEGVNLLPFIDEKRLRGAMKGLLEKCRPEEQARNRHVYPVLCVHDLGQHETFVSSMSKEWGFGTLTECHSKFTEMKKETHIPTDGWNFKSELHPGCRVPCEGFPSLLHMRLKFPSKLEMIEVNLFGFPSRKATIVLEPEIKQPCGVFGRKGECDDVTLAKTLIGKVVHVGWPMLREVAVVAVVGSEGVFKARRKLFDTNGTLLLDKNETLTEKDLRFTKHTTTSMQDMDRENKSQRALLYRAKEKECGLGGVLVSDDASETLLRVRPIRAMLCDRDTGATRKAFQEDEDVVLACMALRRHPAPDRRLVETEANDVKTRFPIGSSVVCLQPGTDSFGAVGTVKAVDLKKSAVQLRLVTRPQLPPFGFRIVKAVKDNYISVRALCRELKIPYGVLLKITGSVMVKEKGTSFNDRTDVGLNFRVFGRLVVPGFMRARDCVKKSSIKNAWLNPFDTMRRVQTEGRSTSHEWELTDDACAIVREYTKKFSHIVESVKSNPAAKDYACTEMFEKHDIESFLKWKRNLPSDRLPLVPVDSVTMPQSGVKACETALNVVAKQDRKKSKVLDGKWYRPSDLLPAVVDTWMEPMKIYEGNRVRNLPSLGERVCNIGSTRVPFGMRGLVVSIHPRTRCVEVVFDEIFVGGTNLSGLCSNDRGFLLPWRHLMSFSSTGQSIGVNGQGFSSVVKKKQVKRDGDMSSLPLLMPFGDAKVEDGTAVSKKETVKKKTKKKKKEKTSAEPTKIKEDTPQVLTGMLQRALGTSQKTSTPAPDASVLTSLLHKAMTPKPPVKSILPVSFFDQSDVMSTKPDSNSTKPKVSAVPIHSSLQKFLNISSPSSKVEKNSSTSSTVEKKSSTPSTVEKNSSTSSTVEKKKARKEDEKDIKKKEIMKKKKVEEKRTKEITKKKKVEEERTKKTKDNEQKKKKKTKSKTNEDKKKKKKKDAPKRVVKKILSRNEKKKERSEDEAVVLTADGVEISLDPMSFWNEMEAEADNEYEAERRARRLQRQAERDNRNKNQTS